MNTRMWSWIALPFFLFLTGCPSGGGGEGGFGGGTVPVAYVVSSGPNEVQAYVINSTTGALIAVGSPVALGAVPTAITVSPNGSFAYVTASTGVYAFTINATTGAITSVAGSPFPAGTTPSAATVSPNGAFLYVSNQGSNNVSAFAINGANGALAAVAGPQPSPYPAGTGPSGVTVSPNGAFLYVSNQGSNNVSAFAINGANGALAAVAGPQPSPYPAGTNPSGVTVSPNGQFLYAANGGGDVSAYSITVGTGALVQLVASPFLAGANPSGVAISPNGAFLYVSNQGSNNVSAYTIDGAGALAAVAGPQPSPYLAGPNPSGITVEPNGQFAYVSNGSVGGNVSGYRITAGTGVLVSLGATFPAGGTPVGIGTPGRP